MGQFFQQDSFTDQEDKEFRRRLHTQIADLAEVIKQPHFSQGAPSVGAELEMYLVDEQGLPKGVNQQLIQTLQNAQLTEELNKFNLEFNLSPVQAAGFPFRTMSAELATTLDSLQSAGSQIDTRIVPIGILPTLADQHLTLQNMTDIPRYRALTRQLSALRGAPFYVDINGQESLQTQCDEVTLEGANTSFQVHLKVPADQFASLFNTAQLITPLVLAISGNSPLLMGRRLWQETRIALFKQSIDNRVKSMTQWRQPARVCFGHGWVREGAWELFAENVALYPPLMPYLSDERKPFAELCLHHGTVWSWNRAVLQPDPNGHLRIEFRAFPAGPTIPDMMASAALAIGLTVGMAEKIDPLVTRLPFEYAEYNFYRAAQLGLEAQLLWPDIGQNQPTEQPVAKLIADLLPVAAKGLSMLKVDSEEINHLLSIVETRLASGITGSTWQLKCFDNFLGHQDKTQALSSMLQCYITNQSAGIPVSEWPERSL